MKWLLIFALFDPATGIRSHEYRAFATEKECREIVAYAIGGTRDRLGDGAWINALCIDLDAFDGDGE